MGLRFIVRCLPLTGLEESKIALFGLWGCLLPLLIGLGAIKQRSADTCTLEKCTFVLAKVGMGVGVVEVRILVAEDVVLRPRSRANLAVA